MRMSHRTVLLLALACTPAFRADEPRKPLDPDNAPLPQRALARLGDHRFYHGPGITCAVLSPDGRRAASSAKFEDRIHVSDQEREQYERTVVLWDAATGQRLHELKTARGPVTRLSFSPDSKCLAAASEATISLFVVETGKPLNGSWNLKNPVDHLQFSADGEQLWISDAKNTATSWNVQAAKQLVSLSPSDVPDEWVLPNAEVCDVVPFPNGKHLAWICSVPFPQPKEGNLFAFGTRPTRLVITDTIKGRPLYRKELKEGLDKLTISRDGQRFAILDAGELAVFASDTGKKLSNLNVPSAINCALSHDGRHALIRDNRYKVTLWNLDARKMIYELIPGLIIVNWDLFEAQQQFSIDGKTVLLAVHSTLRLFDVPTGKERTTCGHHADRVVTRFSADGQRLFTTCDELRRTWNLALQRKPKLIAHASRFPDEWSPFWVLDKSIDGKLFLEHASNLAYVRETSSGRVLFEIEDTARVNFGRFSPTANQILLWHWAEIGGRDFRGYRLYDARTGKKTGGFKRDNGMGDPEFSSNGRFVAIVDRTHDIRFHDSVTGQLIRTLHSSRPLPEVECDSPDLLFSPDNEYVVVANHFNPSYGGSRGFPTRIFHITSGKEIQRFYLNPEKKEMANDLSASACSPDNRLLATAERHCGTIRLFEIMTGKIRAEFKGHRHGVHSLAFSPDGKTLASGGKDNVVFLWDVAGNQTTKAAKELTEQDLENIWSDLAAEDASKADAALARLLGAPAVSGPFLASRLRPAETPDKEGLTRLLADLGSSSFKSRETAARKLTDLGELAEPALREALTGKPSLEVTRRIEAVLQSIDTNSFTPQMLQSLRAVEALEHLAAPDTKRCLEKLGKGSPQLALTREANAALKRLGDRRGK